MRWPPPRRAAAEVLERRYRLLLGWYPAGYRAANEEEMLGVAMAGAAPGRRWPELGEALSLVGSAIRMRLGGVRTGWREPAWRDAGAVLGIAGPVVLAACNAAGLTNGIFVGTMDGMDPGRGLALSGSGLAAVAGWTLVAAVAILGWRLIAAVGAVLGVGGQAIVLAWVYSENPSALVTSWWKLMFAVVIALSALAAARNEQRPLSWRLITVIVIAAAMVASYPALEAATVTVTVVPGGGGTVSSPLFGAEGYVSGVVLAVAGIMGLIPLIRLNRAVRRRVVILLLPASVTAGFVAWTFGGFLASSPRFYHPVLLTAPQWTALGLVPVLVFIAGLAWLGRHERMLREIADGQDPPHGPVTTALERGIVPPPGR